MIFASKSGGSPQHFRQMYDKKVNLLGLISLLTLPEEATPPPVQTAWPQLMAGTMRLLTTLKEKQVSSLFACISHACTFFASDPSKCSASAGNNNIGVILTSL